MLSFVGALRAVESLLQPASADRSPGLHAAVRYDPAFVRELLAMHDALNARFSEVVGMIESESGQACSTIRDCATQLHRLRRTEAAALYPVIAAGIDGDAAARAQLMQLRISLLAQVRSILRDFDELSRAIRVGSAVTASADAVATSLAAFLRRCATEIYPLYDLIGTLHCAGRAA